jgi:HAMP domain-containing protein
VLQAAETVLRIILIAVAVAAGVAALAAVVFIVIRLHRRQVGARAALRSSRAPAAGQPVATIPAPPS